MVTEQPRTALVFPGMGPARTADIGRFLMINAAARRRLAVADEVVGYRLLDAYRTSSEDYAEAAQVVFLVVCLALADWAADALGVEPEVCAGPSFGQKALTAYTGALPFEETVRLTAELARCELAYFSDEYSDIVTHCFVRVPEDGFRELLAEFSDTFADLSGTVDRGFYLVSVREGELPRLTDRVRAIGGYSMHTMRPPVHSRHFGALRRKAEAEVFSGFALAAPRLPVISDQDGSVVSTAAGLREMLLDTFDRPIDWPAMTASLRGHGVTSLCFSGPDNLFHRVDSTRSQFDVLALTPAMALVPRPVSIGAR